MSNSPRPGRNSIAYWPVVTCFSPFFSAPSHRPADHTYSVALPFGHCAEGPGPRSRGARLRADEPEVRDVEQDVAAIVHEAPILDQDGLDAGVGALSRSGGTGTSLRASAAAGSPRRAIVVHASTRRASPLRFSISPRLPAPGGFARHAGRA